MSGCRREEAIAESYEYVTDADKYSEVLDLVKSHAECINNRENDCSLGIEIKDLLLTWGVIL